MQKLFFYPDKLYEIRTKARITQDELAKAVGVSRTTFNKWGNSVTALKEKHINSIALFLKTERSNISNLPSNDKDFIKSNSLLRIGRDIRGHSENFEKKRDVTLAYLKELYHLAGEIDSFYFILDAIFRGTTYPIYIKDSSNKYITANNAFFDLFSLDYTFQSITSSKTGGL
jgi:DNA-binding XRE family transcriptional regulator